MGVLLRSLKFCLTSEGQQAVLAAVICLLVLQAFLDRTPALQVRASVLAPYSPEQQAALMLLYGSVLLAVLSAACSTL